MKKKRPTTVLIVDDQLEVRAVVRRLLERRGGYAIAEAGSAGDALAIIGDTPPRAVILDISMPGGPGFTLIERLKAIASDTSILVLSSHCEMEREILAMGADAFLPKTAPPRRVLATLSAAIGG